MIEERHARAAGLGARAAERDAPLDGGGRLRGCDRAARAGRERDRVAHHLPPMIDDVAALHDRAMEAEGRRRALGHRVARAPGGDLLRVGLEHLLVVEAPRERRVDLEALRDRADHRPRLTVRVDDEDAEPRAFGAEVGDLLGVREREVVGDERRALRRAVLAVLEHVEVPSRPLRRLAGAHVAAVRDVLGDHRQPAALRLGEALAAGLVARDLRERRDHPLEALPALRVRAHVADVREERVEEGGQRLHVRVRDLAAVGVVALGREQHERVPDLPVADERRVEPVIGVGLALRERWENAGRRVAQREHGPQPRAIDVLRRGRVGTHLGARGRERLRQRRRGREVGDEGLRAIVAERVTDVGGAEPLAFGDLVVDDACERRSVRHDARAEQRHDDGQLWRALRREVRARGAPPAVADSGLELVRRLRVGRANSLRTRELREPGRRQVLSLAGERGVHVLEDPELRRRSGAIDELGERERVLHLARRLARVGSRAARA